MFFLERKNQRTFFRWVAAGGGSGFLPKAPGTWGSLVGLAVGALMLGISHYALAAVAAAIATIGLFSIREATGLSGAHHEDPGWIVIDEICGQCVALLGLHRPNWLGLACAFGLFRLLDIAKPGPIGWADRQGGAIGIMADDLLAGAIAALLLAIAGI